jgi:hypothetical protein
MSADDKEQIAQELQLAAQPGATGERAERYREMSQLYDLGSLSWDNPRNSPHVWLQMAAGDSYCSRSVALAHMLRPEAPRLPYHPRRSIHTVLTDGQRMLLMTEIEFLTRHGHLSRTVVYAGAAAGAHIATLVELFPHVFHLYDPMPFSPRLRDESGTPIKRLVLHQEAFTDETARSWLGQPVLFMSDIRTSDYELHGPAAVEDRLLGDMLEQRRWCEVMKPAMACLRFRPPYPAASTLAYADVPGLVDYPTTEYFAGDLFIPPWSSPRTTITRLFTDCTRLALYDNLVYEEQMSFHNRVTRLSLHAHNVSGIEGLDHCWDCASELAIIRRYLEHRNLGISIEDMLAVVADKHGALLTDTADRAALRRALKSSAWWIAAQAASAI